jgi:hypothetical protein
MRKLTIVLATRKGPKVNVDDEEFSENRGFFICDIKDIIIENI